MLLSLRAAATGLCLWAAYPVFAAPVANIGHEPLRCVPVLGNARVVASPKLPDSVTSARVYFRADGQRAEYFLEMRRGDQDRYWALLPQAVGGATAVVYRVVARDGAGNSLSTPPLRVAVSSACPVSLTDEDVRAARNIVLGLTEQGQDQNPVGFGCEGIVGQISPSGVLRNVTPCGVVAGGKAQPAPVRGGYPTLALSATSGGMQSTTAASCLNPDGLTPGGRGDTNIIPPPPPPPPPPTPTPTPRPTIPPPPSQSRPPSPIK